MCGIVTPLKKPAIPPTHAVADTGATSVFVLKGTPMKNIWPATNPLTINLPDGTVVRSTHICYFQIPGLPTALKGHILPDPMVASLIGIRILCRAGCTVVFTDTTCHVVYKGMTILKGYKDPSTDLWILPITPEEIYCQGKVQTSPGSNNVTNATKSAQPRAGPGMACALQAPMVDDNTPTLQELATFTHSMRTRANTVKFVYQSLCNPKILSLMKAM